MPSQVYKLEGIGTATIYKRRGARNIRLSVSHDGKVRVTLPFWAPYKLGRIFLEQKKNWLKEHLGSTPLLENKSRIGKAHQLFFEHRQVTVISSRVTNNSISIIMPLGSLLESPAVQVIAQKAAVRALKKEAKLLLPKRLAQLADKHGFEYRSVTVKELRGRWGSCSQNKDIVLNCYLMQLPWELIDYVILHELVHTQVLAHGKPFWAQLEQYVPNLPQIRRSMRRMQPRIQADNNFST